MRLLEFNKSDSRWSSQIGKVSSESAVVLPILVEQRQCTACRETARQANKSGSRNSHGGRTSAARRSQTFSARNGGCGRRSPRRGVQFHRKNTYVRAVVSVGLGTAAAPCQSLLKFVKLAKYRKRMTESIMSRTIDWL